MAEQKQQTLDVVIAIGSTGLGKSTMIKSYCTSEAVEASSSVESCTKKSHLFKETDDRTKNVKRIWLDTMGAEDSEKKQKDEDILSSVMQMLVDHVANNVQLRLKVLWFVKPECRKTGPLQTQAHFIQHLDGSKQKAWDSTVIVLKGGKLEPRISKIQGALAASLDAGAPCNGTADSSGNRLGSVKCIGFTRIDCLPEDDEDYEDYHDPNYPAHKKRNRGWFNEEEMKIEVDKLVNPLPFLPISVHKQKCKKCGVVGDPRWVNLLCHGQPNNIHPKGDELIHTGGTIYVHQLPGTEYSHDDGADIIRYHSGYLEHENVGGQYHSGSYKEGKSKIESYGAWCPRCNDNIENQRERGYEKFKDSPLWGYDKWLKCNHCNKDGICTYNWALFFCTKCPPNNFGFKRREHGDKKWNSCHYCWDCVKRKQKIVSSSGKWSCCKNSSASATGCKRYTVEKYNCCGGSRSAPGCCRKWSCCGRDGDSPSNGCKKLHICCKKTFGNQGCQEVYQCCKKDTNEMGCSYACCKKKIGSRTCFVECSNCHREFGKEPGCLEENVSHQMIDIQ